MEIGAAKMEIPIRERGIGMMGWAQEGNIVEGSQTPLSARAFVLRAGEQRVAIVVSELCFISTAVKEEVAARLREDHAALGLDRDNVMLLATHTHSGPGGFTHYPMFNLTVPGFVPTLFESITTTIVDVIRQAHENLAPGEMRFASGEFAPDQEVAFNRSVNSYNRNPEVEKKDRATRHLAVDRCMRLLRFDRPDGTCLGSINFFGVHGTSVHSDNRLCHFDNKGYAAVQVEEELGPNSVAAFAQATTGDVTPNFRVHPERKWVRGKYPDDDASARFNGDLQAKKASELIDEAEQSAKLSERLRFVHRYANLAHLEVDPSYVDGRTGLHTGPPELGMAMFFGTDEGPGLPRQLLPLQKFVGAVRKVWRRLPHSEKVAARRKKHDDAHGEKITWIEAGLRRALGISNVGWLPAPERGPNLLKTMRKLDESGLSDPKPWGPEIMPAQIFLLGPLALVALGQEITTTAGARLRKVVQNELASAGVTEVAVLGYANAYAGYLTTPEEYEVQDYEGASTYFGKWTLPAYQTLLQKMASALANEAESPQPEHDLLPPRFTEEDLAPWNHVAPLEAAAAPLRSAETTD